MRKRYKWTRILFKTVKKSCVFKAFLSTRNGHLKFVQFHRLLPMNRSRQRPSFNFSYLHGFQTYSYTERCFPDGSTSSIQTGILVWHMTIIFTFVFNFCHHLSTIPQLSQADACQLVDYSSLTFFLYCKRLSLYIKAYGKPLYREKTVFIKTHKTTINRPMDHTGET